MKKMNAILLVLALIFLCACTSANNDKNLTKDNTTTQTTDNTTTSEVETTSEKPFYTKEIKTNISDPYSYVILEKCKKTEEYLNVNIPNDPDTGKSFEEKVKEYYYMDVYYYLYDLDSDGTDELLLGSWMSVGNDIEAINPVKLCVTNIYTIKNGKAVQVEGTDWFSTDLFLDRIVYSNGMIVTTTGNRVDPGYFILGYENGKIDPKCYTLHADDYRKIDDFISFSNEIVISKKEYDQLYKKFCGDAKAVDIDWKRIDEYSVK